MKNSSLEKYTQNLVEKLVPDFFLKNHTQLEYYQNMLKLQCADHLHLLHIKFFKKQKEVRDESPCLIFLHGIGHVIFY